MDSKESVQKYLETVFEEELREQGATDEMIEVIKKREEYAIEENASSFMIET